MPPASTPNHAAHSRLSWMIATFFGTGYLPAGPGTWASAVTVLLWWSVTRILSPDWVLPSAIVAAVAISLAGIWPSTVVARESGRKDPGFVVIDEVAGQMVA